MMNDRTRMQELVGDLKNVIDPLKETTEKEILKL